MIVHPRIGQMVRVHYNKTRAPHMPYHGEQGAVVIRARGPGPRNHGVLIGGQLVIVPCGNISPIPIPVREDVIDAGTF